MLGSMLFMRSVEVGLDVLATSRRPISDNLKDRVLHFEAPDYQGLLNIVKQHKIDIIVNCIGLLVAECENDPLKAMKVNAALPYDLVRVQERVKDLRLIHVSTDCVYSGLNGPYRSNDDYDEFNAYGLSKRLGEGIIRHTGVVIRTSIIGLESSEKKAKGLLQWFLDCADDKIHGWTESIWSGVTTLELSNVILSNIVRLTNTTGVINLASDPISKYSLLNLINEIFCSSRKTVIKTEGKIANKVLLPSPEFHVKTSHKDMLLNLRNFQNTHTQ